jgi:hypothetical protein
MSPRAPDGHRNAGEPIAADIAAAAIEAALMQVGSARRQRCGRTILVKVLSGHPSTLFVLVRLILCRDYSGSSRVPL